MSFPEMKYVLNSTLGTEFFRPLDRIVEGQINVIKENMGGGYGPDGNYRKALVHLDKDLAQLNHIFSISKISSDSTAVIIGIAVLGSQYYIAFVENSKTKIAILDQNFQLILLSDPYPRAYTKAEMLAPKRSPYLYISLSSTNSSYNVILQMNKWDGKFATKTIALGTDRALHLDGSSLRIFYISAAGKLVYINTENFQPSASISPYFQNFGIEPSNQAIVGITTKQSKRTPAISIYLISGGNRFVLSSNRTDQDYVACCTGYDEYFVVYRKNDSHYIERRNLKHEIKRTSNDLNFIKTIHKMNAYLNYIYIFIEDNAGKNGVIIFDIQGFFIERKVFFEASLVPEIIMFHPKIFGMGTKKEIYYLSAREIYK